MKMTLLPTVAVKPAGQESAYQAPSAKHEANNSGSFLDTLNDAALQIDATGDAASAAPIPVTDECRARGSLAAVRSSGTTRHMLQDLDAQSDERKKEEPESAPTVEETPSSVVRILQEGPIISNTISNDVATAIATTASRAASPRLEAMPDCIDGDANRSATSTDPDLSQLVAKIVRQEVHFAPALSATGASPRLDDNPLPAARQSPSLEKTPAVSHSHEEAEQASSSDVAEGDRAPGLAAADAAEPTGFPLPAVGVGAARTVGSGGDLPGSATNSHAASVDSRAAASEGRMPQSALRILKLEVSPQSHGVVSILMQKRDQQLNVRLDVESPRAAQQLESERSDLTARISGAGYQLAELLIATAAATDLSPATARNVSAGSLASSSAGAADPGTQLTGSGSHQGQPRERGEGQERAPSQSQSIRETAAPASSVSDGRDRFLGARVVRKV